MLRTLHGNHHNLSISDEGIDFSPVDDEHGESTEGHMRFRGRLSEKLVNVRGLCERLDAQRVMLRKPKTQEKKESKHQCRIQKG